MSAGTNRSIPTPVSVANGGTGVTTSGTTSMIAVGGGTGSPIVWTTATGTGAPVRATSPTLVTPSLGAATATSINNVTLNSAGGGIDLGGFNLSLSGPVTISNNFSTNDLFDINGDFLFPNANNFTGRTTAVTDITFPTSGTLAARITATATLNFGSTAAGSASDLTMTLTGAVVGEAVVLGAPNGSVPANGAFFAWVSASNTITVRYANNSLATSYDPASGSFTATIVR